MGWKSVKFIHESSHTFPCFRLHDVFPQGMGFVLVFEFMVSDLSEMIKDAERPLTQSQVCQHN